MPAKCTVCSYLHRAKVDARLLSLESASEIARDTGLTESSLGRHKRHHLQPNLLRELRASNDTGSVDLLERLVEVLDDVDAVRSAALMSGQSALVLRAAERSADIITKLMNYLGVEGDIETIRLLADQKKFVMSISKAIMASPEIAYPLAQELYKSGEGETAESVTLLAAQAHAITAREREQK